MDGQCHASATLPLANRSGTHCKGDWIGRGASLDGFEKSCPPPRLEPQTILNCCTNYAILATKRFYQYIKITMQWNFIVKWYRSLLVFTLYILMLDNHERSLQYKIKGKRDKEQPDVCIAIVIVMFEVTVGTTVLQSPPLGGRQMCQLQDHWKSYGVGNPLVGYLTTYFQLQHQMLLL